MFFKNVKEIQRFGPHLRILDTIRICIARNTRALTSRMKELVLLQHMFFFKVESGSKFSEPSSMHRSTSKSTQFGIVAVSHELSEYSKVSIDFLVFVVWEEGIL